ncbi:DinB family protein [Fodinibius saliphilus]|uniref:DinB family protein n=1 Tax=Fodinibius saliphilus TaxID=1920650 RepID=UPI001109FFB4|nr:DinB family protein [Fodinibius saliphilus]
MNSGDQLFRLFSYDMWANEQVLFTIQENIPFKGDEKCIHSFAHIVGAQELWYARITGASQKNLVVWPDYSLPVALQKLKTLSANWNKLIDSNKSDIDRPISYKNSSGTSYETMLSDILHHVIIHGQHHRAQVAKLLRNAKIDPPATDFIFFSRVN